MSDIAALDTTTHRFEARYNQTLVGDRSTTVHKSKGALTSTVSTGSRFRYFSCGDSDPVVSVDQSRRLADIASRHVEYVEYPGEGHGFRSWSARLDEHRPNRIPDSSPVVGGVAFPP